MWQDIASSTATFVITALEGSPDMSVSVSLLPSAMEYTWRVACVSRKEGRIVVYPSNKQFVKVRSV